MYPWQTFHIALHIHLVIFSLYFVVHLQSGLSLYSRNDGRKSAKEDVLPMVHPLNGGKHAYNDVTVSQPKQSQNMYLLTEWEGRTHFSGPITSMRTVLIRDIFSYGFPRKLRAGPYGSYDKCHYPIHTEISKEYYAKKSL